MGKSTFRNMPRLLLHLHCKLLRDSNIKSTLTGFKRFDFLKLLLPHCTRSKLITNMEGDTWTFNFKHSTITTTTTTWHIVEPNKPFSVLISSALNILEVKRICDHPLERIDWAPYLIHMQSFNFAFIVNLCDT